MLGIPAASQTQAGPPRGQPGARPSVTSAVPTAGGAQRARAFSPPALQPEEGLPSPSLPSSGLTPVPFARAAEAASPVEPETTHENAPAPGSTPAGSAGVDLPSSERPAPSPSASAQGKWTEPGYEDPSQGSFSPSGQARVDDEPGGEAPAGLRPAFTEPRRPRHDITYDDSVRWAERPESLPSAHGKRKKSRWPLVAVAIALFVVVVGGAGIGLFFARHATGPSLGAEIAYVDGRESLVISMPEAPAATRITFRGQQRLLSGGRAVFSIDPDGLDVGENVLEVVVTEPSGAIRAAEVVVTVAYRLYPALEGLGDRPATFDLSVDALPGTLVFLDGELLALDASGHGVRTYEIEPSLDGDPIERSVEYRVQPPGQAPRSGRVGATLPVTSLQIERPGHRVVTEEESVRIRGAVHPSAQVWIDGEAVAADGGSFEEVAPLPQVGDYTFTVDAHRPGRVPSRRTVEIRRVGDLEAEAAEYRVDDSATYATIAEDPAAHRGRRVAMEGLVYNVEVDEGRSMLQVLVTRCPAGRRCPLWVTYPAATDIGVNRWVRVLGEVAGEQQFRASAGGGQILTVPRVDAMYVLPLR